MPLCPLSDDWSCSVELRDLRDIRSVAALPVLLLWADTLVHILSTRSHLQPTAAACQDTFCDSRFLRPRLSGCRSHLLAEYCIQHPIPQVTALLGPESGGPPRPLLNRQSFSVYYGSIQPHCEVTFLLGPVSGEPPRCLLAGWCYRTAWPVSGDDRTVTDLPALQPWVATLVRLPLIGLIEFGLPIFSAACQATASGSCFFQPWLLVYRSYLLEECGTSCLLSEVQAPLGPVRGVPPRTPPGQRCTNTAWHDPRPARSEAAHQSQQHWVTALVQFSSLEFCWQPVSTACGEPRWIRVSAALPSHIRSQCHHHGRGCEGHRRRDVDRNMRRIAQKVEPQLVRRRKRKLVRSRGRPRLKLSPRRRRPPGPGQRGKSRQKPSHCLRAAPRAHSQTLPPPRSVGLQAPRLAPALSTWIRMRSRMSRRRWTYQPQLLSLTHSSRSLPRRLPHSHGKGKWRCWRRPTSTMKDDTSPDPPGGRARREPRLKCSAGRDSGVHATLSTSGTARKGHPRQRRPDTAPAVKGRMCTALTIQTCLALHRSFLFLDRAVRITGSQRCGLSWGIGTTGAPRARLCACFRVCLEHQSYCRYSFQCLAPGDGSALSVCRSDRCDGYPIRARTDDRQCKPRRQASQRSGHHLRILFSWSSVFFVPLLPCAIDPGSGIRAAGPPSQDAVQCSLSYHVLSTPTADVAAHVPLKCLLTDFPVYSCWGSVAMVKHRSWSTKQRSACRPGKKEREIIKTTTTAAAKCAARAPTAVVIPVARIPPPPPAPPRRHPTSVAVASSPLHSNHTSTPHKSEQPCDSMPGDAGVQLKLDALRGRLRRMLIKYRSAVDYPTFVTTQPLPCTEPNPAFPDLCTATGAASPSDSRHREAYMLLWLSCVSILWFCLLWLASQVRRSGDCSIAPRRRAVNRFRLGLAFTTLLLLGFGWHLCPHRDKLCHGHGFALPSRFQSTGPVSISGRRHAAVCRGLYTCWWSRPATLIELGVSLCGFLPCHSTILTPGLLWLSLYYASAMLALTVVTSLLLTPDRTQPPVLVSHTGPWRGSSPSESFQTQHYVRSQVRTALLQLVFSPTVSLCSFDRMGTHTCSVRGEGWCLCLPTSTGSLSIHPSS